MNVTFEELFNEYKNLSEIEKKQAIIEFLKNNIISLQNINNDINNTIENKNINLITKEPIDDHLDVIYQLLHLMTEQVEMFTEKISKEFYE